MEPHIAADDASFASESHANFEFSSEQNIPCMQFHYKDTILDEYGCNDSSLTNAWLSLIPTPILPKDLTVLVTTIEFVHNRREAQEVSATRSNAKRVFHCRNCHGFMATFCRPYNSSKEEPFRLQRIPSDHSPDCPQVKSIPSKDVLINHPLFVSFLKSH